MYNSTHLQFNSGTNLLVVFSEAESRGVKRKQPDDENEEAA